ncbi:hypothetical protein OAO18_07010 [Francisellaceae bacterium]|nr:hypothetical protein [Francisellaceae bacterium]
MQKNSSMNHLIKAVKDSLESENYISALYLAITLPDICARLESSDGKTSKAKYIEWFDKYLSKYYIHSVGADHKEHIFLNGNDMYALRCSVLHEGTLNIKHQKSKKVHEKFFFTVGHPHIRKINSVLQIDIASFCNEICAGAYEWLVVFSKEPENKLKLERLLSVFSGVSFSTNDL